uniref:Immunoglobulin domain-containing protein n=1 Tax=Salvator merianae TaxID=96440 RepID=A0A8D0BFR2_SALMN
MDDFRAWDFLGSRVLLAACFLGFWIPSTQAAARSISIASVPVTPAEGQDVLLSLENVTGTFRKIDWYRGAKINGSSRIFTYFPNDPQRPQRNGPQSTGREFGFSNGSLLITKVQPEDSRQYSVEILLRPRGSLKGTTELEVAGSTTHQPPVTSTTQTTSDVEPPKGPLVLGWIVAGIVVGVLLAGAVGVALVYRFVLHKADPGTGMAGKLDLRGKMPAASKPDDKEPIYEVMDSPLESPRTDGKEVPLPVSSSPTSPPDTCPKMESNYMELLQRTGSVYGEIKR